MCTVLLCCGMFRLVKRMGSQAERKWTQVCGNCGRKSEGGREVHSGECRRRCRMEGEEEV